MLSPVQLADKLLKADSANGRAIITGQLTKEQAHALIVQAVNLDRDQQAPDPKKLSAALLCQYPTDFTWTTQTVAIALETILAMAKWDPAGAQGTETQGEVKS